MKRIFLLISGCLMCGMMKAQYQDIFDEFRREAGDRAEMFSGKIEPGYSPSIYLNHPYWSDNGFTSGDVTFKGLLYRDVMLRYDTYAKQLVVKTPVGQANVYIPMHLVDRFTMGETEFGRRNGEIVAVLFSGSRLELVELLKVDLTERIIDNMKVNYLFDRNVKYLVLHEGQMQEVTKLKSVLKLFPEWKKELRSFAKMHHLDFDEHRRSSLTSLVNYVDQLMSQP